MYSVSVMHIRVLQCMFHFVCRKSLTLENQRLQRRLADVSLSPKYGDH